MSKSKSESNQLFFQKHPTKIEMLRMTSSSLEVDDHDDGFKKEDEDRRNHEGVLKIHKTKKTGDNLSFSITNILQASNGTERWKSNKSLTIGTKYMQERLNDCSLLVIFY